MVLSELNDLVFERTCNFGTGVHGNVSSFTCRLLDLKENSLDYDSIRESHCKVKVRLYEAYRC